MDFQIKYSSQLNQVSGISYIKSKVRSQVIGMNVIASRQSHGHPDNMTNTIDIDPNPQVSKF